MNSLRTLKARLTLFLAAPMAMAFGQAGQHQLRYEWAATPEGPFKAVPREMIRVHADGTATVVSSESRGFFRLLFDGGTGGASVPIRPLDSVPAATLDMLNKFITAIAEDRSAEGADWTGATIAPFVTPVTSLWNESGEPDLVELKINGPCEAATRSDLFANNEGPRRSTDRGFILASLSRKSPPVVGYATDGLTPCESLLANCQDKRVHCIRRFGPMFLAAEDEDGILLGNEGLFPALYPDQAYEDRSKPVNYSWDSEIRDNPPFPGALPRATPLTFSSYPQLREACRSSPWLTKRRQQREALIEFDWLAMEGKAPALKIDVGKELTFLDDETFTGFSLDEEEGRGALATLVRAEPGIKVKGLIAGAYRLTLFPEVGDPHRYLIVVSTAGAQLRGGSTGVYTSSNMWEAGAREDQPRYDQRSDLDRWCSAVGCGPTMLAIQIAWAEHNQNVPSAYWHRAPGSFLTARKISLREINSPMTYVDGSPAGSMLYWYDYLHDGCNVACWANGAGSTLPWDLGDALGDYVDYTCSALMPLQVANDTGGALVGGHWAWTNDSWGDDWDEAGVAVANAIKAGRPGGVYYMEHWHYCVAWRYRRIITKIKVNGEVIQSTTQRLFRVNTGWGDQDRVWNAYDIDGSFLMDLWQKRELP